MSYIVNPKMAGSGVIACIPQKGKCHIGCKDCFFQGGRSFLEPLDENLPNIPTRMDVGDCVVRMNDGNDSGSDIETVTKVARQFKHVFFNTSIPDAVAKLHGPVVLTVNPGKHTDSDAHFFDEFPLNLMFVRVRVNTWNRSVVDDVVRHYTNCDIPVVLTFMAYDKVPIPEEHWEFYIRKMRTKNAYFVMKPEKWYEIADRYKDNDLVYTCGKNPFIHACHRCGTCLREYWHYYDTHRMDGIWPMDPIPEEKVPICEVEDCNAQVEKTGYAALGEKAYQEHVWKEDETGSVLISPCIECTKRLLCKGSTDTKFVGTCSRYEPVDESCALPDERLPYGERLSPEGQGNGICDYNIPYKYW